VLSTLVLLAAPTPSGASPTAAPAPAAGGRGVAPALVLLSQTPWVTAGQSFDLHLRPTTSAVPTSSLGLTVAVYSCLSSVSGFDQSVTTGPAGDPLSSTSAPIPVSGLPTVAGGVDLSLPVVVGGSSGGSSGPYAIHLVAVGEQCQSFPAGVYPVRIELVDTSGGAVLGSFTTHLVYSQAAASTQRLRAAVVLPVQVTQRASRAPSPTELLARPAAALATPPTAVTDAVAATVATVATQEPSVPVTLQVSGQTVGLLGEVGRTGTVSQLAQLAATPEVHELTAAPYTPVDAGALVDAGMAGELGLQVARGVQTVAGATDRPAPVASSGLGAWVSADPLDAPTVTTLATFGFRQVVLPASDVVSPPSNGSTTQPFPLAGTRGTSLVAMASDDDLTARFTSDPGNPVLAAHQLVAELAQLYYERPNGDTPRAVLAVAPSSWPDDPAFVGALLASLDGNPLVQAVTTAQVFALYPDPAPCRSGCRLTGTVGGGLPTAAIRVQRVRVNGFATAAVGARTVAQQLGDLVLGAEARGLRPTQQSDVAANAGLAVDAQLGQVAVEGDQSVTLTASSGLVPVTVVSGASYPVVASLVLSSDKLLFPNGETQWARPVTLLPHHSNVVYVRVRSRASGVFRLDVSLWSPDGSLRLATGALSVRSTSSSVVGVILTAGAVLVLAVWWFRTSVRRRTARRAEEAGATATGGHGDGSGTAGDTSDHDAAVPS